MAWSRRSTSTPGCPGSIEPVYWAASRARPAWGRREHEQQTAGGYMAGLLKTGVALTIAIAVAGCATTAKQAVNPSALGVAEAAKAIRDKQVTSTQLTQAALDRAE